jgi:hypothetical protein
MPVKRTRARPSKEHVPQQPPPPCDAEFKPDAEAAVACGAAPSTWAGCCACSKSAKCLTPKVREVVRVTASLKTLLSLRFAKAAQACCEECARLTF